MSNEILTLVSSSDAEKVSSPLKEPAVPELVTLRAFLISVPAPLSGLPSNLKRRTLEPRTLSTTLGNSKSWVKDATLSGNVIYVKKKAPPIGEPFRLLQPLLHTQS